MKYEYGWLINMAITLIGGIICYVLTKEIILGVFIAVCVFLGLGVIILWPKKSNKGIVENGQPNEEIGKEIKIKIERFEKAGIENCDESIKKGITTEKGLEDVKDGFCCMVTAGTKFTNAYNFISVVRKCGVRRIRDNVRFLLAHPDSKAMRDRSREAGKSKDRVGAMIRNTLRIFKQDYKDCLHVRFYLEWYTPWIRLFFVDERYVLLSFYTPGERGDNSPQLKIIKNGDIERSFYAPFKEIFEMLWEQGEEVDWDKY